MSCAEKDDNFTTQNSEAEENNNSKINDSNEDGQIPATNLKRKLPSWMLPNNVESSSSSSKKPKEHEGNEDDEENKLSNGSDAAKTCGNLENRETINVKIEPVEENSEEPSSSNNNQISSGSNINSASIKTEVSSEEKVVGSLKLNDNAKTVIKPAIKVEKADATSTSVTRTSCKYGIKCYRLNPIHRAEEAHPGDTDYRRPNFPPPPAGTPDCPYGSSCYRRNPIHFQHYNHPPDTDFEQNYKNHCMRLRKRRQRQQNDVDFGDIFSDESGNSTDWDDYDLNDPFIDDGDSDYLPSNDEDSENRKSDEDFDDDIDKAEE